MQYSIEVISYMFFLLKAAGELINKISSNKLNQAREKPSVKVDG